MSEIVLDEFMAFFQKKFGYEYQEKKPYNLTNYRHTIAQSCAAIMRAKTPYNPENLDDFRDWFSSFLYFGFEAGRDWHRENWKLEMLANHFDAIWALIEKKQQTHGNSNRTQSRRTGGVSQEWLASKLGSIAAAINS